MITVLIVMITGIIAGVFIHRKPGLIQLNERLVTFAIYILLLLLGISVGINKTIISNLGTLGLQALIVTLGAVGGSVLMSWLVFRLFFISEQNTKAQDEE